MNWTRIARALLLPLGAALLACGPRVAPPKVAADAPPIDACALLPEEEAIQLAGEDLDPVSTALDRRVDREIAKCSYANLGGPPFRMISLEVRRYPTPELARSTQESTLKFLRRIEQEGAEDVAGLGESALWGVSSQQLHLLTGDLRLIVTVQLGDRRFRGESARDIAGRALERLKAMAISPPPQALVGLTSAENLYAAVMPTRAWGSVAISPPTPGSGGHRRSVKIFSEGDAHRNLASTVRSIR